MDVVASEAGKGLIRVVAFLLVDLVFWALCYRVGYLVCKLATLGKYPRHTDTARAARHTASKFWCAILGLFSLALLVVLLVMTFR